MGNSGFSNDRPVVGGSSLLERYPERQPNFLQLDLRLSKMFAMGSGGSIELIAEAFNVLNNDNLFSNPSTNAVVSPELSSVSQAGDCFNPSGCGDNNQNSYRFLNQISPGSTPFAVQLGARFRF